MSEDKENKLKLSYKISDEDYAKLDIKHKKIIVSEDHDFTYFNFSDSLSSINTVMNARDVMIEALEKLKVLPQELEATYDLLYGFPAEYFGKAIGERKALVRKTLNFLSNEDGSAFFKPGDLLVNPEGYDVFELMENYKMIEEKITHLDNTGNRFIRFLDVNTDKLKAELESLRGREQTYKNQTEKLSKLLKQMPPKEDMFILNIIERGHRDYLGEFVFFRVPEHISNWLKDSLGAQEKKSSDKSNAAKYLKILVQKNWPSTYYTASCIENTYYSDYSKIFETAVEQTGEGRCLPGIKSYISCSLFLEDFGKIKERIRPRLQKEAEEAAEKARRAL